MKRLARIRRVTRETSIAIRLCLDGTGKSQIRTSIGFMDHMLASLARHGRMDLNITARGDLHVDQHHLVEDLGIVLGQALDHALGPRRGINRAGYFIQPMDEALAVAAVDIAGRPHLSCQAKFRRRFCGDLDTDLIEDFLAGLAAHLRANITVRIPAGRSDHHKLEALFKALGRALHMACSRDRRLRREMPSVKGVI